MNSTTQNTNPNSPENCQNINFSSRLFSSAATRVMLLSAILLFACFSGECVYGQARIFVNFVPLKGVEPFENIQDALNHIQANIDDIPKGAISVVVEPGDYCEDIFFPDVASVALLSNDPSNPADFTLKNVSSSQNKGGESLSHTLRGFRFTQNNDANTAIVALGDTTLTVDQCEVRGDYFFGVSTALGGTVNLVNSSVRNTRQGLVVAGNGRITVNGGDVSNNNVAFTVAHLKNLPPPVLDLGNGTLIENNSDSGIVTGEQAEVNIGDIQLNNNGSGFLVDTLGGKGGGGGSFFEPGQSGVNITITNCTFRGTSAAEGGAITANGDVNLVISGCTFENNTNTNSSASEGAAIQLNGTDATIMNCTFSDNLSEMGGGAIQCNDGADPVISGCTFENNRSDGSFDEGAGAVLCDNSSPMILDCDFIGNTARIEAGAIRNINGSNPQIQNCMFIGNNADRIAGAILNQSNSMPMISGCSFEMNMTTNASSDGGAIFIEGASPVFDNCMFEDNVSQDTGAVFIEDSSSFPADVIFDDCIFSGNVGGTMSSRDASLTLTGCQFNANQMGTVLSCLGSNVTLDECQFESNVGRAIFMNDTSSNPSAINATNCSFNNHVVDLDGAAMFAFDTDACFLNCSFTNNSSAPNGGALLMVNSELMLKFCHLENNSATELGGAVGCFNDTNGTFIGCAFAGNASGIDGGAVFCSGQAIASYQSCSFSGNSSTNNGGALVSIGVPGDSIGNCTFTNNTAGNMGGVVAGDDNTVMTINNSILWENGATPIHLQPGSSADVTFSNVQGGFAGTGNMDVDPLFENSLGSDGIAGTFDDDLRLQATSPMIDAADNNAVPADNVDVDNDGDVAEPMPFDLRMMARFVDNPDVVDVGNGDAPIVDMGAIEFSTLLLGDVNLDGSVNLLDVGPFIERLSDGTFQAEADINQDGTVNLLDVGPFIELLSG